MITDSFVGMHPDIQIGAFVITDRSPVWCGLSTAAEAGPSMIPSTREKKGMDLSAIWNAITQNLATVSLVSVGGPLWAAIKWSHHRFNKKHRFRRGYDPRILNTSPLWS